VIRANQLNILEAVQDVMAEHRAGAGNRKLQLLTSPEVSGPGKLSQCNDEFDLSKKLQFSNEIWEAIIPLFRGRLVLGWDTPDSCGDIAILQLETILAMLTLRLIAESGAV